MADNILRIATRKSPLAVWQAEHVAECLRRLHPDLQVELVKIVSKGDKLLDAPLAKVGGKGLFVKELEKAMLDGEADIAVHSMKDVPMEKEFPPGLHLAAILKREDPRDAFVSNKYANLDEMPHGARVGTSSLRRQTQIQERYPHLEVDWLRGNVQSRLAKLDDGQFDAILLAAAGLKRLGMEERITACLSPEQSLPAVGQGAIGIECRSDDQRINALLAPLNHEETAIRLRAERGMNNRLNGGCQVPIGGYALLEDGEIWLRGLVGSPDGREIIRDEIRGPAEQAQVLGAELAERLLAAGADRLLAEVGIEH